MRNKLPKKENTFKTQWKQFMDEGKICFQEFKNPNTRYKQIPNMFTASRLLAPFFIIPSVLVGNLPLTAIFVTGFALTDAADGYFARKYNATSEFGRKLDALTDKLFAAALLIPLTVINPTLLPLLAMEGVISAINVKSQLNNNVPKTKYIGKIKTAALSVTIGLNYINLIANIPSILLAVSSTSTFILQGCSATKYYCTNRSKEIIKHKKEIEETKTEISSIEESEQSKLVDFKQYQQSDEVKNPSLSAKERAEELRKIREQLTYRDEQQEKVKEKKISFQD